MERLLEQVKDALCLECAVQPGAKLLVAVSGGADSVALLRLLHHLHSTYPLDLSVIHYEHGIRGQASQEDQRFVEILCRELRIDCFVGQGNVPEMARTLRKGMEETARLARYGFFQEILEESGAQHVALAHHQGDQGETMLMHWIRGAGLGGLAGMEPVNGPYIRPLLRISSDALRAYLRKLGQTWREDATNQDRSLTRAYLRHEIMPRLRQINPKLEAGLGKMATLLSQENAFLEEMARTLLAGRLTTMPYGGVLSWKDPPHPVLAARMLRAVAHNLGMPELDLDQTKALLELTRAARGICQLPGAWRGEKIGENLHIISPQDPLKPHWESRTGEEIGRAWAARLALAGETGDGKRSQRIPKALLSECIWRTRRPGDWMRPFGMAGTRKLSDILVDRKIDRPFRDQIPLLARGGEVLWAVGIAASEMLRGENEEQALLLTWNGDLPWLSGE